MKRFLFILWPAAILAAGLALFCLQNAARAEDRQSVRIEGRLRPSDYLLGSGGQHKDPVFDRFQTVELGLNLGIGSDCGRVDFKSTLQASLSNVLDAKYFENLGKDILAASPMLLTCYFSPTWCAILKHSQVSAHFLSQGRLDQCALIDKYTDSRVEDYYQERQSCVRKSIDKNNGDLEHAMESCQGDKLWQADLADWSGTSPTKKASTNKLIGSSAKWAGLDRPDTEGALGLVKALVGDTVVSKGNVSVEYGPRRKPLTPRVYLQSIEETTYDKLCGKLLPKIVAESGKRSVDHIVSDEDLKELSPNSELPPIDRQTLRSLAMLPSNRRKIACRKLADAMAVTSFAADANRSLDLMTTLAQNPHLPPLRKAEMEQKRQALKEQVELTLELQQTQSAPLNSVLSQINEEGARVQDETVRSHLTREADQINNRRNVRDLWDCSDGFLCNSGSQREGG